MEGRRSPRTIERLREQFLPEGLATATHSFYTIEETFTGAKAGGLWYMLMGEDGKHQDIGLSGHQRIRDVYVKALDL